MTAKTLSIVALMVLTRVASGLDELEWEKFTKVRDADIILMNANREKSVDEQIGVIKRYPLFLRVSILNEYASFIGSEPGPTEELTNYTSKAGQHDLRFYSGRIAALFDAVLGCKLPVIRKGMTEKEREEVSELSKAFFEVFIKGIQERDEEVTKRTIAQLFAEFKDKIHPVVLNDKSDETYRDSVLQLYALLQKWYPLGRKVSELEEIVGKKCKVERDSASYRFRDIKGGYTFEFSIDKDKRITRVAIRKLTGPLE